MNIEYWFRFPNENLAIDLRNVINSLSGFPVIGRNAKTKLPAPDKQTTDIWVEEIILCIDGKYGFKAPDERKIDDLALTEQENINMHNFYEENTVEFDSSWLPVVDP